jgi:hypothetical protein
MNRGNLLEIWGHHSYFICVRDVAGYDAGMKTRDVGAVEKVVFFKSTICQSVSDTFL